MSQPMNREQRRMLKKQGQEVNDAGQIVDTKPRKTKTAGGGSGSGGRVTEKGAGGGGDDNRRRREPAAAEERTSPGQFIREVRSELKKVAWPTRAEVINYSIVVFVTILVVGLMIYGLDWVFSTFILELFENN